jgi:hypothetical protein
MDLKRLTGRLKLRFLTEIGQFQWNQGEEVAHFDWFAQGNALQQTQNLDNLGGRLNASVVVYSDSEDAHTKALIAVNAFYFWTSIFINRKGNIIMLVCIRIHKDKI